MGIDGTDPLFSLINLIITIFIYADALIRKILILDGDAFRTVGGEPGVEVESRLHGTVQHIVGDAEPTFVDLLATLGGTTVLVAAFPNTTGAKY